MRKGLLLIVLMTLVALVAATALWAQRAPGASGKAPHAQCTMMHAQADASGLDHQAMACHAKGNCCTESSTTATGACCTPDSSCAQSCCANTENGMQCTMTGDNARDCGTQCAMK